jgi:hypothetical protein
MFWRLAISPNWMGVSRWCWAMSSISLVPYLLRVDSFIGCFPQTSTEDRLNAFVCNGIEFIQGSQVGIMLNAKSDP